jgi:Sulfatase-modifying factor enzyme 1
MFLRFTSVHSMWKETPVKEDRVSHRYWSTSQWADLDRCRCRMVSAERPWPIPDGPKRLAMDQRLVSSGLLSGALRNRRGRAQSPGPSTSFDPAEPDEPKRVMRGGSFLCTDQYCSRYMLGTRGKGEVTTGTNHLGFRCVKGISKKSGQGIESSFLRRRKND